VIINDTVGFIRDLPPDLITAFRATLEEMEGSDILIHLVDASSAQIEEHIESVEKILVDLNLSGLPRLLVYNKADLLNHEKLENMKLSSDSIFISALDRDSLLPMIERVSQMLETSASSQSKMYEEQMNSLSSVRLTS
jgi:GTP-binding protein HflX